MTGTNLTVISSSRVKKGDAISYERAIQLFYNTLSDYENQVKTLVTVPISQNQFDALVSFTYNLGARNFSRSTLLRKININPADPSIAGEFLKWNYGGGRILAGLTRRRSAERDLYFTRQ